MLPTDPETHPRRPLVPSAGATSESPALQEPLALDPHPHWFRSLRWVFFGSQGLRAGCSIAVFLALNEVCARLASRAFAWFVPDLWTRSVSPGIALLRELNPFLGLLAAAAIVARIERRSILAFNLAGPKRPLYFFSGLVAGFAAVSVLVAGIAWGGWIQFGPIALSGTDIFKSGALWAVAFFFLGCYEEGMFRCYLLFTLTRGINFWWALAIVGALCLYLMLWGRANLAGGVYLFALLGLFPCLLLHLRKRQGSGFWHAAWVTSTLFGFLHTSNVSYTAIHVFAVALLGFLFCVSVRVTGSAWWAIGCHTAWNWADIYFFGTPYGDLSAANGHFLTTSPVGAELWSGGADYPEGSLLMFAVILLLFLAFFVLHGRKRAAVLTAEAMKQPSL